MKKIVITAVGTRGDIRPAIQLAKTLAKKNDVTIIAPPENEPDAIAAAINFLQLGMNYSSLVEKHDLGLYRQQVAVQFNTHHDVYEKADWSARLGVCDGSATRWFPPEVIAAQDGWKEIRAELSGTDGREILLVLECASGGPGHWWCAEYAFIDEFSVRGF